MPASLLTIPVDIKVMILDCFDARAIQLVRRICSDLKGVVDWHKGTLAKTINDREIARLQSFIDHHDYEGLSLVEALRLWVAHRGIWFHARPRVESAYSFSEQYCWANQYQWDDVQLLVHEVKYLVWVLLNVHLSLHEFIEDLELTPKGLEVDILVKRNVWTIDNEDFIRDIYEQVRRDRDCLDADFRRSGCVDRPSGDHCQLTPLKVHRSAVDPGANLINFDRDLAIPRIRGPYSFAYHTFDDDTEQLLLDVINSNESTDTRSLQRAAVLEDLVIY